MAHTKKICKVCGKEYEACRTEHKDTGVFRWQDVACSPECGSEYFRRVAEARSPHPKGKRGQTRLAETKAESKETRVAPVTIVTANADETEKTEQ